MRTLLLVRFIAIFTIAGLFSFLFLGVNNSPHLHFDENGQAHAHSHPTYVDDAQSIVSSHDNFDDTMTLDIENSDSHSHSHAQMHTSFLWDLLHPNRDSEAKSYDIQKSRPLFVNSKADDERNRLCDFTKRFLSRDEKFLLNPHYILDTHVQKRRSIRLII